MRTSVLAEKTVNQLGLMGMTGRELLSILADSVACAVAHKLQTHQGISTRTVGLDWRSGKDRVCSSCNPSVWAHALVFGGSEFAKTELTTRTESVESPC